MVCLELVDIAFPFKFSVRDAGEIVHLSVLGDFDGFYCAGRSRLTFVKVIELGVGRADRYGIGQFIRSGFLKLRQWILLQNGRRVAINAVAAGCDATNDEPFFDGEF